MKKDDVYHSLEEEGQRAKLHEPEAVYQPKAQMAGDYPVITQRELDENCMTLEESKRLILEMVHKHYHP